MNESVVYLHSSALLKLVFEEAETTALRAFLADHPRRASSVLTQVDVLRSVARVGDPDVTREAREVLARVHLIRIDDGMLAAASEIGPPTLRSSDSIHLVTALSLQPNLAGAVVYDVRFAEVARQAGLTVFAPA